LTATFEVALSQSAKSELLRVVLVHGLCFSAQRSCPVTIGIQKKW
jgi:hypothetical protein